MFLRSGTHLYALLKPGLWQEHILLQLCLKYAVCQTIYLSLILCNSSCIQKTRQIQRILVFQLLSALQRESEKEDRFNHTLEHVKALPRFVNSVHLPSCSTELIGARQKEQHMTSRSRYGSVRSSICIPCTLNTPPGNLRHRSSQCARKREQVSLKTLGMLCF